MEEQSPVPPITQIETQKTNKGWKLATIITSVVALCGIGFGAYEMLKPQESTKGSCDKTSQTENTEEVKAVDEGTKREIIKALEKYTIHIDSEDILPMYVNNFAYGALDNFTKDFKDKYAAWAIIDESNETSHLLSFSYESANEIYHSYFGDADDLSKKDYAWFCQSLEYNSDKNVFNLITNEDCGIGGSTPERILYEIDSVRAEGDRIAVRLNSVIYNSAWGTDLNLEYQSNPKETLSDSLASHVLYFEKYNDSYVLVDINK